MKLGGTSDSAPSLSFIDVFRDELLPVFTKIEEKYVCCNIDVYFVFRCLPDKYERKSKVRFSKKDNTLYFDLTVSEEKYKCMNKNWQRYDFSHYFYSFFCEKIRKYKIDNLDVNEFIKYWEIQLKCIGWLKNESEVWKDELNDYVDDYEIPK